MCGVFGCIVHRDLSNVEIAKMKETLMHIFNRSRERGRDSFGYVAFSQDNIHSFYGTTESKFEPHFDFNTKVVLANVRAEPTTEWQEGRNLEEVAQPFAGSSQRFWITHNGTIANDKELMEQHSLKPQTSIDSEVIACWLEQVWDGSTELLHELLRSDLQGSFALGVVDSLHLDRLWIACNYKPLYVFYSHELDVTFFASMKHYLIQDSIQELYSNKQVVQIPPYTLIELTRNKSIRQFSIWKTELELKDRSAFVICSGGLDSTVAAKWAIGQGYDVTLLHFLYRCRAEISEISAVKQIAKFLQVPVRFVSLPWYEDLAASSPLLSSDGTINYQRSGVAGAEFAYEWVPARNFVMYAVATAIAEAEGYSILVSGINLEEAGAYPDNEQIFSEKLDELMPYACAYNNQIRVISPLATLMKHEIVKLGLQLQAPMHLSWSCYNSLDRHCGQCAPCFMRKTAFHMNGVPDPVFEDRR
jgi:7-cyano-7-deazaguanine synthase